jgi:hypothetical protein
METGKAGNRFAQKNTGSAANTSGIQGRLIKSLLTIHFTQQPNQKYGFFYIHYGQVFNGPRK